MKKFDVWVFTWWSHNGYTITKGNIMGTIQFIKPNRRVDRIFLHCSASDVPAHDNVETIRKWHLDRGFDDIG